MSRIGRIHPFRRTAIPAWIVVAGFGLSYLAYQEARRVDDALVRETLDQRATWRAHDFQDKVDSATDPVWSLATFFATQADLDRGKFHAFAIAARGKFPIARLSWTPLVPGGKRAEFEAMVRAADASPDFAISEFDANGRLRPAGPRGEYAAVRFEERLGNEGSLVSFDRLSEPARRAAAESARDTGIGAFTPLIPLPGETRVSTRTVLFWPVFPGGVVPPTVAERRAALLGYMTGAYLVEQMVSFAVRDLPPEGATLSVYMGQTPEQAGGIPAVQARLDTHQAAAGSRALGKPDAEGLRLAKTFDEFGQTWTLVFDFSPQLVAELRSPARWHYLGLGLVLTIALASYAASQQRRQSAVEKMVDERTRDLSRTTAQIEGIIESSPLATGSADADRRIAIWNRAAERLFGYSAAEIRGTAQSLVPEDEQARSDDMVRRLMDGEILRGVESRNRRKDGSVFESAISAAAFRDSSGAPQGFVFTIEDISERKRAEQELRHSREHLIRAQRVGSVCSTEVDLRTGKVTWTEEVFRLMGLDPATTVPGVDSFAAAAHPEDRERVREISLRTRRGEDVPPIEFRVIRPDGDIRWIYRVSEAVRDAAGTPVSMVTTISDITELRMAEAQIAHMAHHDALTNLPNRVLFREKLEEALRHAVRGVPSAVLYLDLDRFKTVNDTLGHPIGDALLKAVTERLLQAVRQTDTVARLGGDEFAVVQSSINGPGDAKTLATRFVREISQPYDISGNRLQIGVSIGIAMAPEDGTDPDQLLKRADIALYRAKSGGRNRYTFFEENMDALMQARRLLELDLRNAVLAREFELHYQPVVDLADGRIMGFEALIRWNSPSRGMVMPGDFIPLAEEVGLIGELSEWVLKTACAEARTWPDALKVAVNISAAQFRRGTKLVEVVAEVLQSSGLGPGRLELEVTEASMIDDLGATLGLLHRLKEQGVHIAMDDFGTGFSSLSFLRSFPFDKIKIDRSFVSELGKANDSEAIVRAVLGLCDSLGVIAMAEGVETAQQLATLRHLRCAEIQGYLIGKPRPPEAIPGLLAEFSLDRLVEPARRS